MKLLKLIFSLSVCFFSFVQISAQVTADNLSNIKVDELSDAEVKAYYQKGVAAGFSDEQLFQLSRQKGLPEVEVQKLKTRVSALGLGTKKSMGSDASMVSLSDSAKPVSMRVLDRDKTIFGSELFTQASSVFQPDIRIATPASYTLGPGDVLTVNVYGYSEQTYNLPVSPEGSVYIQNVGPIQVSGLSIDAAETKIRAKLASTIYKAIAGGQTKVAVALGKIRSIQVTVIGQASQPGTYTISSLSTLFNLLYVCGGPSDKGSYRNIELIRGDRTIRKVDLYSFLLRGDRKDNVLLADQDVVRIPYYNNRVQIDGEVKRSGKFEMQPGENFDNLLTYAGGFGDSAYRGAVKVSRINDDGISLSDVKQADFATFLPKTGDGFIVDKALNKYTNRVTVLGAVMRPGIFALTPGMTLAQVMQMAGGLREDAFPERGLIKRLNDDLTPASLSFAPKDMGSAAGLIGLKKEDIISIPSIFDLKDEGKVWVEGEVRKPGNFKYQESLTLKDVLTMAGGFNDYAETKTVEISRRRKTVDLKKSDFIQTELIQVDLSAGFESGKVEMALQPYDIVVVRKRASAEQQRSVYVEGQVFNAGKYVLAGPGERISNLLTRTGGFKGSADSNSISIRRVTLSGISPEERQRILERNLRIDRDSLVSNPLLRDAYLKDVEMLSVNVQKIKKEPGGSEDLILEDGDYITVARASSLVRVSGEVNHPTSQPFSTSHRSARYYINQSGDYTSNARRSKVFVIYPDGRAASVRQFMGIRSYPKVTPRSEIYVPAKYKEGKKGMSTGEWIAVSSILASLATMAVAVINSTK